MIINDYSTSSFFKTIQTLMNSADLFYLTGSRFFGNHKPNSDYDFFVKDSHEVHTQLIHMGFSLQMAEDYINDSSFMAIYVLSLDSEIIQIQVIKESEFQTKKEAQDLLASIYGDYRGGVVGMALPDSKDTRRDLWKFAKAVVSKQGQTNKLP